MKRLINCQMAAVLPAFLAGVLWLHPQSAAATTRTVTSLNDDNGAGTLRATIQASATGDTINFDPGVTGTISLTNGQLVLATNLTISGPGAAVVSISGHTNGRVFSITGGTVNISGLTMSDGSTTGGGGGIFSGATLSVSSCIFSNNSSQTPGGAIFNSGTLTVSRCMFLSNSVLLAVGGGLFNGNGTANVSDSTFFNNTANAGGGALFSFGTLTLTNCTISGNFARLGGGISMFSGSAPALKMSGCTVCSNVCTSGGGIYQTSGTIEVQNSIIAGNSSSTLGPDVYVSVPGVLTSDGYNLIGETNGSSGWIASDLMGSTNAPLDPKLGPLQDNGGPTWTHALKPGSLAIDAGNGFGLAADQRGRQRPYDLSYRTNAVGGDGCDIGAFELIPPVLNIAPSSTNVALSWPTNDTGYQLESSPALLPATWTPVPGTPAIAGNRFTVTNGPATGIRFYRLKNL